MCQAIWLQNFILRLGIIGTIVRILKIYCDNFAAISFPQNTRSFTRSKHIDIKYLFVKEKVFVSNICIEHISTKRMSPNPLTKNVTHMGLVGSYVVLS
jgi:hypothetical protein